MMSNPAMEKPTEEQAKRLAKMLADMGQTVRSIEAITDTIGDLRRELNETHRFLGRLREVIGPEARCYGYGSQAIKWHDLIDERMKAVAEALK